MSDSDISISSYQEYMHECFYEEKRERRRSKKRSKRRYRRQRYRIKGILWKRGCFKNNKELDELISKGLSRVNANDYATSGTIKLYKKRK